MCRCALSGPWQEMPVERHCLTCGPSVSFFMFRNNLPGWLPALVLMLLFMLGAVVRCQRLPVHATHVDDLLVPRYMNMPFYRYEQFRARIHDSSHTRFNSQAYRIFRQIDEKGWLPTVYPVARYVFKVDDVAINTTFAPGQMIFSALLVWEGQSYETTKVMARAPSLVFGLLALALLPLLIALAFRPLFKGEQAMALALIPMAVLACSWQHIILSVHSATYSVGVFWLLLILILVLRAGVQGQTSTAYHKKWLPRPWLHVAIWSGVALWFQFQLLFFVPAIYVAYLYAGGARHLSAQKLGQIGQMGVIHLVFFLPLYVKYLYKSAGGGVHWNAGPQLQYAFWLPHGWGEVPGYFFRFFTQNMPISLGAMASHFTELDPAFKPFAIALVLLCLTGLWFMGTSRQRPQVMMALFTITTAFVWFALVLAQKITLSPTRHSLILLPLVLLCLTGNLAWLAQKMRRRQGMVFMGYVLASGAWALWFLAGYPAEARLRTDPYSEEQMNALVQQHRADAVLGYDWTYNTLVMPSLWDPVTLLNYNDFSFDHLVPTMRLDTLPQRILLHGHRKPLNTADARGLARALQNACGGCQFRYQLTPLVQQPGQREHEFSGYTRNGKTGQFIYLMQRDATVPMRPPVMQGPDSLASDSISRLLPVADSLTRPALNTSGDPALH